MRPSAGSASLRVDGGQARPARVCWCLSMTDSDQAVTDPGRRVSPKCPLCYNQGGGGRKRGGADADRLGEGCCLGRHRNTTETP
jgi:hypothetical protein